MTHRSDAVYSPPMISGWQQKRSFVIKFKPETDPDAGRFYGRIEHVASGRTTWFESAEELLQFLHGVLRDVCVECQQAETLAEEMKPANDR
jgi:hypothetical protein